jgi:hypothetical protein
MQTVRRPASYLKIPNDAWPDSGRKSASESGWTSRQVNESGRGGKARPDAATPRQSNRLHFAVIVAMIAMRMMQVSVHEIIDMIAVRDR